MSIVIFGAGGLGREVLATLQLTGHNVIAFVVEPGYAAQPIRGVPVFDNIEPWLAREDVSFVIAVGDCKARARIASKLHTRHFPTLMHPAVAKGHHVEIGKGAIFLGPASMTTDVQIGEHALINPGCVISHDCKIGAFANLGPGVSLAGGVTVGEGADLGVGAVVAPRCTIGAGAIVGAGAVVIRDVDPGATVVGVPARPIVRRAASAAAS
ncbi:NeuD/PglB/VioB family sugar acetyltransferase [Cupriavidus alkaliphilus]|uniref:NeuD/PglB/VioB family sugar acetyltransferase n=1 Tax=Cupriavidus alkaliphilus TaxID=942866 RepID=UPI000DC22C92|nr:NeuD/PglB/VioB family sugar acetyltransferase [Cupriavidus alkaliphilus]MBB3012257.1 sugar O-acyltransferase (sialic acid O-acetyltransferase NeuD family) [Cupriavidus alkaliphilus]RAS10198.1 sugar O-acyltransferase (sialic acid O-acetyltransferase NeuD family) [Cupriavidus alkaliphilus]